MQEMNLRMNIFALIKFWKINCYINKNKLQKINYLMQLCSNLIN